MLQGPGAIDDEGSSENRMLRKMQWRGLEDGWFWRCMADASSETVTYSAASLPGLSPAPGTHELTLYVLYPGIRSVLSACFTVQPRAATRNISAAGTSTNVQPSAGSKCPDNKVQ